MIALLLAACATSVDSSASVAEDSGADPNAPVWYGDIEPLVTERCSGCHVEGAIGGFSLDSYEAAKPMAAAMAASVTSRKMPPWKAEPGCRAYEDDISLSEDEIARINAWAAAGAPEGDAAKSKRVAPEAPALSRVDATLSLPVPFTPTVAPDDYRCFLVDWPVDHTTYVTGYRINPDQTSIVHHLVAYIATPDQVAEYQALDDAEDGPGWTCFGGPGISRQEDAEWLGAWAPGATNGDFPDGTGIQMEPGSKVVLQMHYNTASAQPVADQTTMDVRYDDTVEAPATIQPWTDPRWLGGKGMDIPAQSTGTEHEFSYTFGMGTNFLIHTAALHMHTLGRTGVLEVEHADGSTDCLLDIEDWDFNWQRTYTFTDPLEVGKGDTLRVRCTWDNPTDQDVNWGEGTADEMCLGTMLFSY